MGELNMSNRNALCALVLVGWFTAPPIAQVSPKQTLEQLRPGYPTPMSTTDVGDLLNATACEHEAQGWRLLGKDFGNRCPVPGGQDISCDFLLHAPTSQGWDVFIDVDGPGTPAWLGPHDLAAMLASNARTAVMPLCAVEPPTPPGPTENELAHDAIVDLMGDIQASQVETHAYLVSLQQYIGEQVEIVRAEHQAAAMHEYNDDIAPPPSPRNTRLEIALGVLGTIAAAVAAAR